MHKQSITPESSRVTFVLPGAGALPIGGFKAVYEYANALARRGWHARVVHPDILTQDDIEAEGRSSNVHRIRRWLGYHRRRITGSFRPDRWFNIDPKVELLYTRTLEARYLPPSDVWIATWWYTAKWVAAYPGARLYLIQGLEVWGGPEAEVMATWKFPLRKVVVSRWLQDVARGMGEASDYIPYGFDFNRFGVDICPDQRNPYAIAMMYHNSDWKGSTDGLQAIYKAQARMPQLRALLFGVPSRPPGLPAWVEYHRNPLQSKLREIYNRSAVFLSPSWSEGWGLTPCEALQCGTALAVTDIGGHREYARHEETALLSPPKDPDALSKNIVRLIEDRELRLRLARAGREHIQQFTWDRAVTHFESVLRETLAQEGGREGTQGSGGATTLQSESLAGMPSRPPAL